MLSTRILSICAVLAALSYVAIGDSYTSKKDDDLVRLLKAGCKSARLLKQTADANGLKPPYKVKNGQVLEIPCTLPKKMVKYTNKYVWWELGNVPINAYSSAANAEACSAACLADSSCVMVDWEDYCYVYPQVSPVSELQDFTGDYVYIKVQVDL